MTLPLLGVLVRCFVEYLIQLRFVCCVSHNQTEMVSFGEEDHRSEVAFSSHLIKDTYYQPDLPLLITDLDHLEIAAF